MQAVDELDLFGLTEIEKLERKLLKTSDSLDALRKGMFARHHELFELFLRQDEELKSLRQAVSGNVDTKVHESTNRLYFAS